MTTIRPLTGGINLEVWHIDDGGYALINIGPLPKPSKGGYVSEQSARYPVADLLAALDAVPKAESVPVQLYEDERAHWKARAEKAEAEEFEIGERVRARGHGMSNNYGIDRLRAIPSAPHWGESGTVVARQDRLYTIRFDDGHEVGFYHNELDREDKL